MTDAEIDEMIEIDRRAGKADLRRLMAVREAAAIRGLGMRIRDDRYYRRKEPPPPAKWDLVRGSFLQTYFCDYDRVLHNCPDCRRSHFVTVGGCPDAEEAAAETAMVDGRKVA